MTGAELREPHRAAVIEPASRGRHYVPSATGERCDQCTGYMPASQDVWIFVHRDGVSRLFCSSACCSGWCLARSGGEIATAGMPWAKYLFMEGAQLAFSA